MSLIPIKLLCNRRPKSSSGSGSGSGSSSSGSGTTTNSVATNDWFYFNTEENSVHCKYPLVGDSEVSAFGYGSSSGSGGGGGSIDPSVLADYVTKSELNAAGYVTSSYLDSLDYDVAIEQLNSSMSGLAAQVQSNKNNLTAYNTRISTLEQKVETLETYNLNDRMTQVEDDVAVINNWYYDLEAAIQTLSSYLPIFSYMELCHDNTSSHNAYIKFKCPIISTGDVGAFTQNW